MNDKMVGTDESFQQGYEACLKDIQKEINQIRYNFQSLSIPIIEGIMNKLESTNGDHRHHERSQRNEGTHGKMPAA